MSTYKQSRGMPFRDGAREEQLLDELRLANNGPLSAEGLEEVVLALLELTRKEVSQARQSADAAASAR